MSPGDIGVTTSGPARLGALLGLGMGAGSKGILWISAGMGKVAE